MQRANRGLRASIIARMMDVNVAKWKHKHVKAFR
jgi:hypothetical protein